MFNLTEQQKPIYYKLFNAKRDRYALKYEYVFRRALESQLKEVIKTIKEEGINLEAFKVPTEKYLKPMRKAFEVTYNEVGIRFYNDTRSAAKSIKGFYYTKGDDSIWLEFVLGWVNTNAGDRITNISNTTLNLVRRTLDKSVQDGLSIPNTIKLMEEQMLDFSKWRAKMIARTEIISASNLGNYEGAISTNLPMTKTWLAFVDSRTRDNHVSINGTTVSKENLFIVGGDEMKHPGDINAAGANVINCRCVLTWEVL
jgi:hypothetical protein